MHYKSSQIAIICFRIPNDSDALLSLIQLTNDPHHRKTSQSTARRYNDLIESRTSPSNDFKSTGISGNLITIYQSCARSRAVGSISPHTYTVRVRRFNTRLYQFFPADWRYMCSRLCIIYPRRSGWEYNAFAVHWLFRCAGSWCFRVPSVAYIHVDSISP